MLHSLRFCRKTSTPKAFLFAVKNIAAYHAFFAQGDTMVLAFAFCWTKMQKLRSIINEFLFKISIVLFGNKNSAKPMKRATFAEFFSLLQEAFYCLFSYSATKCCLILLGFFVILKVQQTGGAI